MQSESLPEQIPGMAKGFGGLPQQVSDITEGFDEFDGVGVPT